MPSFNKVLLVGIPYEGKQNFFPGASQAPLAIRWALESIEIKSFYQERTIPEYEDLGDLPILEGEPLFVLKDIKGRIKERLGRDTRTLFLGGDHTITWATFLAYFDIFPDLFLIHLDAHLDRRDSYEGEMLNHATVIKRIEEVVGEDHIFSLGVRSIAPEEKALNYSTGVFRSLKEILKKVGENPIYLSIDVDVFDPSQFPAVGNPEPGGPNFSEILNSILLLRGKIVASDIVEVNPRACRSHFPLVTAAVLVRELLILLGSEGEETEVFG